MVQICRAFGKSLHSAKKAGGKVKPEVKLFNSSFEKLLESGRIEVCEWKDIKPDQVEDAGSEPGSWSAWLREWLIEVYMMLKSWWENVYSRKKKMDTSRPVFGPLLCPSFIEIDEKRKESQFRWLKNCSPSQSSRLSPLFLNTLGDRNYLAAARNIFHSTEGFSKTIQSSKWLPH